MPERLSIRSLDFCALRLAVPVHRRDIDVKRKHTSVRQLPLLAAEPGQLEQGDEMRRQREETVETGVDDRPYMMWPTIGVLDRQAEQRL
jgi:hypothetical protein